MSDIGSHVATLTRARDETNEEIRNFRIFYDATLTRARDETVTTGCHILDDVTPPNSGVLSHLTRGNMSGAAVCVAPKKKRRATLACTALFFPA